MVNKTIIKVKPETYERLEKRKGFNGCVSFDDVLKYMMETLNQFIEEKKKE